MATLNLGRIKPVFRGAYAVGTAYVVDDIVTSGNETFICILASTGNATSNATYWTKLAAKGTDGTDLTSTITTQGDILFRDGSGLQRLAKGTGSQTLQMNSGATAPEWVTVSGGILKKTYHKMFKGGRSISGFSASSPSVMTDYQLVLTPQTTSSVFLATYNVSIGSWSDHTMWQAMAKIGSGSFTGLGRQKANMDNNVGFFDSGSYRIADSNTVMQKTHSFYYAPATVSAITFAMYFGQHGGTAYFGRSSNSTTDDYTAMGMTLRVDEYESSSSLVNTEYLSN